MKKIIIPALAALTLVCGCAKTQSEGLNDSSKRFLDAWIQVYHPELVSKKVFPGYYIMKDVPGTGDLVGPAILTPYIRAEYRITDLEGNILTSTYEEDSYKLRTYVKSAYYGPEVFGRQDNAMYTGLDYAVSDMKVGGTRELLIPGWLMGNERFETEEEYIRNVSGTTCIYKIEVKDRIQDVVKWEQDSLWTFVRNNYPYATCDTTGFYRQVIRKSTDGVPFQKDTTIYINYIGRRLDGMVFDTSIADTAKVYGLYSSSGTYGPVVVKWNKDASSITMGTDNNSVITGFAYLLSKMGPYEKAIGMFTSDLGYSSGGSGNAIPGYSPLLFEVEVVDKE